MGGRLKRLGDEPDSSEPAAHTPLAARASSQEPQGDDMMTLSEFLDAQSRSQTPTDDKETLPMLTDEETRAAPNDNREARMTPRGDNGAATTHAVEESTADDTEASNKEDDTKPPTKPPSVDRSDGQVTNDESPGSGSSMFHKRAARPF